MQENFQGFSNFIYFFLNGPFYMLFEQSIVKLCAIFAVFVKVRIVLRKQYFFVRYKTPSAFFANGVLVLARKPLAERVDKKLIAMDKKILLW